MRWQNMSFWGCRYSRAAAQHVLHDKPTGPTSAISQPVAGAAAAGPAEIAAGHERTSNAAEPAAAASAAVAADANPESMGDEGLQILPATDKPEAEADSGLTVIRVVIEEARGLPEATSGAQHLCSGAAPASIVR